MTYLVEVFRRIGHEYYLVENFRRIVCQVKIHGNFKDNVECYLVEIFRRIAFSIAAYSVETFSSISRIGLIDLNTETVEFVIHRIDHLENGSTNRLFMEYFNAAP